jgi:hypothetical protein
VEVLSPRCLEAARSPAKAVKQPSRAIMPVWRSDGSRRVAGRTIRLGGTVLIARNVGEFVEALGAVVAEWPLELRGPLWFRGQQDAAWSLEPSLWRSRPVDGRPTRYTRQDERNFTHRFRTRAALRLVSNPAYDDHPTWLGLMQHYGLPTRMLDWSRSPLIAAFFALRSSLTTKPAPVADGATVWILRPHVLNARLHGLSVTPAIDSGECADLVSDAFTDAKRESSNRRRDVMSVMATEVDMRMFVQQGAFTIHPGPGALNDHPSADEFLSQIVIPAESRQSFAREVDLCGFRQGDIFPDLGHLADELVEAHPPGSVHGMKGAH